MTTIDAGESAAAEVGHQRASTALGVAGTVLVLGELAWLAISAGQVVADGGDPWQTGDWLIDLAAGPVRRGLFGELLFTIVGSPGVLWLTLAVQIGLLAALTGLTLLLFWRSPRTPAWSMLVFSPAFLLFPPLSPEGALRKELIGLAAFALLAAIVRFRWHPAALVGVVVLFALGASAHELTALLLPAFAYLLVWGHRHERWTSRTARITIAVLAVIGVAAVVWGLAFPASEADTAKICSSWTEVGLDRDLCGGALRFHSRTFSESLDLTKGVYPSYLTLVPLVVLSLLPLFALRAPRRIWLLLGATFLALSPLFLVAIDYGRWIFVGIALTSLTCLATWTDGDFRERRVPWWAVVAFVLLWSLPYAGPQTSDSVLVQVLRSPVEDLLGTSDGGPDFGP